MPKNTVAPVPKVTAAGLGGIATTILVLIAQRVLDVDLPPEVASGAVALVAFIAGYLKRDRAPKPLVGKPPAI